MGRDASYSAARLLGALAKVPAHVAVLSGPNHIYVFVNDAYAKIVGVEAPIGKPFGVSRHGATSKLREVLDDVYTTGVPFAAAEMQIGTIPTLPGTRYYDVNFIPLRDESGAIDGILMHSFDVTDLVIARSIEREQRMLQAQLLHVQKLESLGLLAGGIAHDFNNMLAAVQGSVAAASLTLEPANPAQPLLRDSLEAARRAADLTRQLLAYSGKGRFEIVATDLSMHVAELTHLLESTLPKKAQLRVDLRPDLPAIDADPAQVQQVVMNLVINAAESLGDERGVVHVTTGVEDVDEARAARLSTTGGVAPGRYVFLEVRDTGCGMDEATATKIFDPFFTTKFTGRGLGLAAVQGIVRAHKGGIELSTAPGKGSTFRVLFVASGRAVERRAEAVEEHVQGSGLVLVVDDDDGVRRILRHMLEHYGFSVVEAADGRHGIEVFGERAAEVRFVILDMTMPELSGQETFHELQRLRSDVRVVLSSGYDEVEATRRFATKGLAAFLPKPFTPADLVRCIRAALADGQADEPKRHPNE